MKNCSSNAHDPWLEHNLEKIISSSGLVVDLACGQGRNARFLASQGLNILCIDRNSAHLSQLQDEAAHNDWRLTTRCLDLETGEQVLPAEAYSGMLVFRYLHRPLMAQIKASIEPGGWLLYQTFRREQAQYGRPKNPDFLLEDGELLRVFEDWQVEEFWEGIVQSEQGSPRALARIFARKS